MGSHPGVVVLTGNSVAVSHHSGTGPLHDRGHPLKVGAVEEIASSDALRSLITIDVKHAQSKRLRQGHR